MIHLLRRLARYGLAAVILSVSSGLLAQSNPELHVVSAPSGMTEAIRGQVDTVSVTIGNSGSVETATTFDVTIYLSADEIPSSVEKVGDLAVSTALGTGDNRVLNVPVRVPSLQGLGDYFWLVQVDAANVISEDDENNNVSVGNAITIAPTPPDLVVSSLPSGPIQAPLATTVSVSTSIQNVGAGATSDPFDISVYLSLDSAFGPEDIRVGKVILPDVVLPGETRQVSVLASIPADFVEGDYRWITVVNADGAHDESDDTNNTSTGTPVNVVLIQPDLSQGNPPEGPSAAFRGADKVVSVEITNSGEGATAQAFDVVIYISEDPVAGNGDDVRVGDVAVTTELAVGETRTVVVTSRVSAVQATGVYYWIAVVDDGGFVIEGDEENNTAVGNPFSVLLQPADLVVTTPPTGPEIAVRNSFHDVSLEIENRGAGTTTGAFQLSIFLSNDGVAGNADDIRVGNLTISDAMIENDRRSVVVPITIPSDQESGSHFFVAIVDATGVEAEFNEENNVSFASSEVLIVKDSPDLAVVTDPFGPTQILREGGYTVAAEIQNQSSGRLAEDFTVTAVLSTDDEIGNSDDVQVGETTITGGLVTGEVITVDVTANIPVGLALGTFRWGIITDREDAVDEGNEANNNRAGSTVTVEAFPPDLLVSGDLSGPEEVSRGRLYDIGMTIENAGQGETIAGFEVAVYLSLNDSVGDSDDLLVGSATIDEVFGPGQSRSVGVPVIVPSDQAPAQFRWAAIINPGGLIVESDRTNNIVLGNLVAFPVLDLPEAMSFGSVTLGQSKTRVLNITNTGTTALSFDVESLSSLVKTDPPVVDGLAPGETQTIEITVTPTEQGAFDGDIRIISELRGTQIISLGGQTVIPNRDRVRLDLDSAVGIQDVLERGVGVNQNVSLELHVEDLPDVSGVTIQVAYDPAAVALVTNGLTAGSFASADALVQTNLVSPGVVEIGITSQSGDLGRGSGHLGTVMFRTIGGFYDQSGVSETTVEAVSVRYQEVGGAESLVDVSAAIQLNLNLTCWSDFNGDGEIGFGDFLLIVDAFNASSSTAGWLLPAGAAGLPLSRHDANGDDVVDFADFVIFQASFGLSCP
jgi:hypothetical protein